MGNGQKAEGRDGAAETAALNSPCRVGRKTRRAEFFALAIVGPSPFRPFAVSPFRIALLAPFHLITLTGVPISTASKNRLALEPGIRIQPFDAGDPGRSPA